MQILCLRRNKFQSTYEKLKKKNELFYVAEERYQKDLDIISLMKSI